MIISVRDGKTPYIGANGNWWIGDTDTGVKADAESYTETDPTVPAWAKAASKPTYTASEVGAAPAYTYGTTDLTAGSSSLTTGTLYFVYE